MSQKLIVTQVGVPTPNEYIAVEYNVSSIRNITYVHRNVLATEGFDFSNGDQTFFRIHFLNESLATYSAEKYTMEFVEDVKPTIWEVSVRFLEEVHELYDSYTVLARSAREAQRLALQRILEETDYTADETTINWVQNIMPPVR